MPTFTDSGSQLGLQEPLQQPKPEAMPLGLQNPYVAPPPAAGTPSADISVPVYRPGRVAASVRPVGPANGYQIPLAGAGSANVVPLTLPSGNQPNQANLVPIVAVPVLARAGPGKVAWIASINLAGFTSVRTRGAYRDLKMTPGWRGIQLQYASGAVTLTENIWGQLCS